MRIAFVCFYEAFPPRSGAAAVSYQLASHLAGERTLLQLGASQSIEPVPGGLVVFTIPGATESRLKRLVGLRRRLRQMTGALWAAQPEVVVLEGASWVLYHWLLLKQIRRHLPNARVVFHAHNVEYDLRQRSHSFAVTRITRSCEQHLLREADACFAVSDTDAAQFEKLYRIRPQVLPNGVDCKRFSPIDPGALISIRKRYGVSDPTLVFMGLTTYPPNREAIDFLVGQVMPQVLGKIPKASLLVLGGSLPDRQPWLKNPGIIPYEDVPPLISNCAAGLAPIFSGSGTRVKVLEYLAAALPVVATCKAVEGLQLTPGVHFVPAENKSDYVDRIIEATTNVDRARELGRSGQKQVRYLYSWEAASREFQKTIQRLIHQA